MAKDSKKSAKNKSSNDPKRQTPAQAGGNQAKAISPSGKQQPKPKPVTRATHTNATTGPAVAANTPQTNKTRSGSKQKPPKMERKGSSKGTPTTTTKPKSSTSVGKSNRAKSNGSKKSKKKGSPTAGSQNVGSGIASSPVPASTVASQAPPVSMMSPNAPILLGQKEAPAMRLPDRDMTKNLIDLTKDLASPHLVPSSLIPNVYDKIYNCAVLVVHCPTHQRVAVARSPTDAVWLPYLKISVKKAWMDEARAAVAQVLAAGSASQYEWLRHNSPVEHIQLLEIMRMQIPHTHRFVMRLSFYIRLKKMPDNDATDKIALVPSKGAPKTKAKQPNRTGKYVCCKETSSLLWGPMEFLCDGSVQNCWGPELIEWAREIDSVQNPSSSVTSAPKGQIPSKAKDKSQSSQGSSSSASVTEESQQFILPQRKVLEFGINQLSGLFPRKDAPRLTSSYDESLKKIEISDDDIERLYTDFIDHTFPCFSMTYDSFRHYLLKNDFEKVDLRIKRFFYAANTSMSGYMTFNEVLMAMINMERETLHVEFRINFVFNYYDAKQRGCLFEEDFREIVRDLYASRTLSEEALTKKTHDIFSKFKTTADPNTSRPMLTFEDFKFGIGSHVFRGTSALCRSRRNIFATIHKRISARMLKLTATSKGQLGHILSKTSYSGSCRPCKERNYRVVNHMTFLNSNGYFFKTEQLDMPFEFSASDASMGPSAVDTNCSTASTGSTGSATASWTLPVENLVTDRIAPDAPALQLIQAVRAYNKVKPREPPSIGNQTMAGLMNSPAEREQLIKWLQALVDQLVPILKQELRCRRVPTPAFMVGDIHGNLEDLMSLERTIWHRFPELNGIQYVFLGDYVDRGRWSVECALYLASMKLLRPQCITLLRGNHEVRDIQIKYTYRRECLLKYGDTDGQRIFDLTNRIFDHLPMCAVVGETIFCAHGGIPHQVDTVEELESIPKEVCNPELDSPLAWEIMWCDPLSPEQFQMLTYNYDVGKFKPGFCYNAKRGTAHYFTDIAADKFLADNQLNYIIRGHEVPRHGFMFNLNYKSITVFSCSHYCGNDNDCGVALVDGTRMRMLRIETAGNFPATDQF